MEMSIRVVCPNGHVLQVKNIFAGKSGLCPICRAKVDVPQPNAKMSEDDIIGVIGPHDPSRGSRSGIMLRGGTDAVPASTVEAPTVPKKCCTNCNREIASGTHICPFCRTYIANLSDL